MKRKIYLIGAGAGGEKGPTLAAKEALAGCTCVFGSTTLLESLHLSCASTALTSSKKIKEYLEEHPDVHTAAVILPGDPGFGKEGEELRAGLKDFCTVETLAGVGLISYFCARIGCGWQGAALLSDGADAQAVVSAVRTNERTFLIAGNGHCSAQEVCGLLCGGGLGTLQVVVGEALGTDRESISFGSAAELSLRKFMPVSVLCVENPEPVRAQMRICIPDDEFFHSGMSMTRSEVRAASVGKLCLKPNSVVYDIGCGTGSVSVECALQARAGIVYAIDKNRNALELTEKNRIKFGAYNIKIVEGEAPDVLRGLPMPDCVFIGGSTGSLPEIMEAVLDKNPRVRIVLNAISLETVLQAVQCLEHLALADVDIVQLSAAKCRPAGGHKLMQAQNPVYIISGTGAGEK
ncbi:MAG: precorrin-6Y C5,15-methyltransferase (decarboxylating) subunit CbiT [Oscillospiraceae bacterium]|jgi:precorrin-6Y C5,15-methyltransferase (decarboxylating)|nr:precorrin-6Y C5,15-methyltransferase (decarboxylating) subunit CbiT [Oscillospiraceae bacterium]